MGYLCKLLDSQRTVDLEVQVLGMLLRLRSFLIFICICSAWHVAWLARDRHSSRLLNAPREGHKSSLLALKAA